jgi:hypothetical protein
MNTWTLAQLLERHPLVFFHLVTVFAALIVGAGFHVQRVQTSSWLGCSRLHAPGG